MAKTSFAARKAEAAAAEKSKRATAARVDADGAEGAGEATVPGDQIDTPEDEDELEYEVLEPGTIIGDIHFPNSDAKKGEEWLVWLKPSVAEHQQKHGVCLRPRT